MTSSHYRKNGAISPSALSIGYEQPISISEIAMAVCVRALLYKLLNLNQKLKLRYYYGVTHARKLIFLDVS